MMLTFDKDQPFILSLNISNSNFIGNTANNKSLIYVQ